MAEKKVTVICSGCGKKTVQENKKDARCAQCGNVLKSTIPLPACDHTVTAEQERFGNADNPCDEATDKR